VLGCIRIVALNAQFAGLSLMDNIIYWLIAMVLFASAWGQWVYALGFMASSCAWLLTMAVVVGLVRCTSHWHACVDYVMKTWSEFHKIHWAGLDESRALSITVSLMIGVLSVMLWLMDQLAVWFLTRWV